MLIYSRYKRHFDSIKCNSRYFVGIKYFPNLRHLEKMVFNNILSIAFSRFYIVENTYIKGCSNSSKFELYVIFRVSYKFSLGIKAKSRPGCTVEEAKPRDLLYRFPKLQLYGISGGGITVG